MKRFAAHGPMIEDSKHGTYARYEDVRAELARLEECIKQLTAANQRISRLMKRNQDLVFDIIAAEEQAAKLSQQIDELLTPTHAAEG